MATTTQTQFDFTNFNNVVKDTGTGLKICLAERLLIDAQIDLIRFKNPACGQMMETLDKINVMRKYLKEMNDKRKADLEVLKRNTEKLAEMASKPSK
jgi:hypothetical protein